MTTLTSQTTFTVQDAAPVYEETADLVLLPENVGSLALRKLTYPGDLLPPLVYESNPDKIENFDSMPLTARPQVKAEMTLGGNILAGWPGYLQDQSIKETWSGSQDRSRLSAYFLRRLWEYFANPPASGYITWTPRDRTQQAYNIVIESLTVGGANTISLDWIALRHGYVTGEVVWQFRVIGEAD